MVRLPYKYVFNETNYKTFFLRWIQKYVQYTSLNEYNKVFIAQFTRKNIIMCVYFVMRICTRSLGVRILVAIKVYIILFIGVIKLNLQKKNIAPWSFMRVILNNKKKNQLRK